MGKVDQSYLAAFGPCVDRWPGIANFEEAMSDGYSEGGGGSPGAPTAPDAGGLEAAWRPSTA